MANWTVLRRALHNGPGVAVCFAVLACVLPVQNSGAQDINTIFDALSALYEQTDGDNWTNKTNWDTTTAPTTHAGFGTWYGVRMKGNKVAKLLLPENNLSGPIPSELGNLVHLDSIYFRNNNLTGTIPSELGNLTNLSVLQLHTNQLTGEIPSSLGNLTRLEVLQLNDNDLEGSVPDIFSNYVATIGLAFQNNNLSGALPASMTGLNTGKLSRGLFWGGNTGGLCAPNDAQFQGWLADTNNRNNGPTCWDVQLISGILEQHYTQNHQIPVLSFPQPKSPPSGYAVPKPWTYTLTSTPAPNWPAGLTFDATATPPTLSGTPTTVQTAKFYTFKVVDGAGKESMAQFSITVHAAPLLKDTTIVYTASQPSTTHTLPAATGGYGNLAYSLSSPPSWLTFTASSRALTGAPTTVPPVGIYKYEATDANGAKAMSDVTIEVRGALALQDTTIVYTLGQPTTTHTLPAAAGGGDAKTYSLTPPDTMQFDPQTRELRGVPTTLQGGSTYTYTYQVEDANKATASASVNIDVNDVLLLSGTIANQVYTQNHQITPLTLPAATGGTPVIAYSLLNLPNGLSFDASTQMLSGTPTAAQPATNYTYQVTDANGATAALTFSIATNPALALSGASVAFKQNETVTPPYALPAATGGTPPTKYSLSTPLPAGLQFDSDATKRTLAGTPTGVQAAKSYTYQATDANGATVTALVSIEVTSALAFAAPLGAQTYLQNQPIQTLTLPAAAAGTPPYHYSLSPNPPAGLQFDSNARTLSGTPTAVQPATTHTYRVQDADGTTDAITFTIEVKVPLSLPGTINDQVYPQNRTITPLVLPAATGGFAPHTYSLAPALPTGLIFVDSLRTLSGTPTQIQPPIRYTYTAADNKGSAQSTTFTIAVVAAGTLVLPAVQDQVYSYGEEVSYVLPEAQGGAGSLVYYLNNEQELPSGLSFNGSLRVISGTAQQATAPRNFTYSVVDAAQERVEQPFSIEVRMTLEAIGDQVYEVGKTIDDLVLPQSGGGSNPHTYRLSPPPPDGLVFNPATRTVTGTPTAGIPKTAYTYTTTDASGLEASETFYIEVHLAMEPISDQSYVLGEEIRTVTLPEAVGGSGLQVYTLAPDPPGGLRFIAQSRTLSGTPTEVLRQSEYAYSVVDANGATGQQAFNMKVTAGALQLPTVGDQHFLVGRSIGSVQLPAATGGQYPHQYRLSPDPPQGLSFDPEFHTLSGTPSAESPLATYEYTVEDAAQETASQTFRMQVHAALALPLVPDLDFAVNKPIAPVELPKASGGLGPPQYSISPDPPAGLEFNTATRVLSGTPTASSSARYTYTVMDTVGSRAEQVFGITVYRSLALPTVEDQLYEAGQPIADLTLPEALGGSEPYVYGLSPALPPGLEFDAQTRTLSGTPTTAMASVPYTYSATDDAGLQVQQIFQIGIRLGLAEIADQTYAVGTAIPNLVLPAAVGGADPLAYELTPALPPGLGFDAQTRTLSGSPTSTMAQTIYTYKATDANGLAASEEFAIEVSAEALALASVPDQIYAVDEPITPLALPAATGGLSPYSYALSPDLPAGLTFDAASHTISGTPTSVMKQTTYTYEVTDQDAATAAQTFTIAVGTSAALLGDRAALIALYKATDGPNWTNSTNWLKPSEEEVIFTAKQLDDWHGVTAFDGRVRAVGLPLNNLQGTLPAELAYLTAADRLQLPDNGLRDAIPEELGHMRSLEQLHLNDNLLAGDIPESLGRLSLLRELWLYGNELSGAIPARLGHLENLEGLLLSGNELTGTIPSALGDLARLRDLWLQDNDLSGTIPSELGRMDSLQALLISGNELSGAIPPVLSSLSHLTDLWLHGNNLTGSIPTELGQLDSLQALLLSNNELSGQIPLELGDLSNLRWLQLQENALEGAIPSSVGRLARLERLHLATNRLTGALPDSLGQLTGLEYLYVHENELTGPLPASFLNLRDLKELFFDGPLQEVCAPVGNDWQGWMASLATVRGPDCGAASTVSFKDPILAKSFVKGKSAVSQIFPPATGGKAPYRYALYPEPPLGLTFDAERRTLAGTPVDTVAEAEYTYVAIDDLGQKGMARFTLTVLLLDGELLEVHGNYPNPFRESTSLELSLGRDAEVSVGIYDLLGRRVLEQSGLRMQAGRRQRLAIEGLGRVSGVYLYRVQAKAGRQTLVQSGRMMLVN